MRLEGCDDAQRRGKTADCVCHEVEGCGQAEAAVAGGSKKAAASATKLLSAGLGSRVRSATPARRGRRYLYSAIQALRERTGRAGRPDKVGRQVGR